MRIALGFGLGLGAVALGLYCAILRHGNCTRAVQLDSLKGECDSLAAQIVEMEVYAEGRHVRLSRGDELLRDEESSATRAGFETAAGARRVGLLDPTRRSVGRLPEGALP